MVQEIENQRLNPLKTDSFLSDSSDPIINFFNLVPKQSKYFIVDSITIELNSSEKDGFSILHLNIRSLNKNFETLKTFSAKLGFGFQFICLTKSWCSDDARIARLHWYASS